MTESKRHNFSALCGFLTVALILVTIAASGCGGQNEEEFTDSQTQSLQKEQVVQNHSPEGDLLTPYLAMQSKISRVVVPQTVFLNGNFTITYDNFYGYPVELTNGKDGRLILRVRFENQTALSDRMEAQTLLYLKSEVERFFNESWSTEAPAPLGNSGYSIRAHGTYPIWIPYGARGSNYYELNLMFAERSLMDQHEKVIKVWGKKVSPEVVGVHYPYQLRYPQGGR